VRFASEEQTMRSLQHQRGMTLISWVFTLVLVGFVVYVGLKVVPIYINAYEVRSVLTTLKGEPGIAQATPEEIRSHLGKMLNVNYIDHPSARQARISGGPGDRTVDIDYQARTQIAPNVELVFSFDPSVHLVGGGS